MVIILLVFIYAHPSVSQIFDGTADGIFESIIGDIHELKKINRPKGFAEHQRYDKNFLKNHIVAINNTHIRIKVPNELPTTTEKMPQVTPIPKNNLNISIDQIKVRMRKILVNQLLERHTNIPDFNKNEDDPEHITRRFEAIDKEVKQGKKPSLRQPYHWWQSSYWPHYEKVRLMAMMAHFVYATRYKLPYVQLLRKKYKYHFKYKIGYCFALLRNLKQQQYLIYTTLNHYYDHFDRMIVQLKLYEKMVRLHVDIRDLDFHIRHLNYLRKLEEDPEYYDDSPEAKRPSLSDLLNNSTKD